MSLSQLLNTGRKLEEKCEPPIPPIETIPVPSDAPTGAGNASVEAPASANELKLAQELVKSQEAILKEDAERRVAEDEQLAKDAIARAAETAKAIAEQRRVLSGNSTVSGGYDGDIHPGLDPEVWLEKHQLTDTAKMQFRALDVGQQKKLMEKGSLLFARDQSALLITRIRILMSQLGAPAGNLRASSTAVNAGMAMAADARWNAMASMMQAMFNSANWGGADDSWDGWDGCGGKGGVGDGAWGSSGCIGGWGVGGKCGKGDARARPYGGKGDGAWGW